MSWYEKAYHLVWPIFLVGYAIEVDVGDGPRVAVDDTQVDGLGAVEVYPLLPQGVVVDDEVCIALHYQFYLFYHLVYNSKLFMVRRMIEAYLLRERAQEQEGPRGDR